MRQYKMLPLTKRPDAYVIKPQPKSPKIIPNAPRTPYRILAISADDKTATICADMKTLVEGKLSVIDVDVFILGVKSVSVGDILSYDQFDKDLQRPYIICRFHQSHQYPKQLLTADES